MKCPVCKDTTLLMNQRQEVEVDYCPQCRGVWLDRGELDKLLERAAGAPRDAGHPPPVHRPPERHRHYRKSWLSDFFD